MNRHVLLVVAIAVVLFLLGINKSTEQQTGGSVGMQPCEFDVLKYASPSQFPVALESVENQIRSDLFNVQDFRPYRPIPPGPNVNTLEPTEDMLKNDCTQSYINPQDMTPAQRLKFKHRAKLERMTPVDYTNWLQLFIDDGELHRLTGFHRANARVVQRGGTLTRRDLPNRPALPKRADHQYMEMIRGQLSDPTENVPQPEFLGYQPSNFDEVVPHSRLRNRNMRHLDYMNPDEPLKTWIPSRGTTLIQ